MSGPVVVCVPTGSVEAIDQPKRFALLVPEYVPSPSASMLNEVVGASRSIVTIQQIAAPPTEPGPAALTVAVGVEPMTVAQPTYVWKKFSVNPPPASWSVQ